MRGEKRMRYDSPWSKAIIALIVLAAFLLPSTEMTDEARDGYERAAYEALMASPPSPSPSAAPDASAAAQDARLLSPTKALPTFAPTPTPAPTAQYTLPMDTYDGGYAPLSSGYYDAEITLSDGSTTAAQCYQDPTIEASYYTRRLYDSTCHFVRVKVKDASQLRTALAKNVNGSSSCHTSDMAAAKNALVAISGEYYTKREGSVFVVKQSNVIKSNPSRELHQLIIDTEGNFHITTNRSDSTAMVSSLRGRIYQAFSFGPELVKDGSAVDCLDYAFDADSPNPRTAIGQIGHLEYLVCVVNGRTDVDAGVTMPELAEMMAGEGCVSAYNLDGGGTSTLYWKGEVVNDMNESGKERSISDCVYFASALPN